jgi:hypothetical protein
MMKFSDQLFEDLLREHGAALRGMAREAPAPARRRARPIWATTGLATAAAAVTGAFVLFGTGASPAYAVTRNADGTVSVSVAKASGIGAANAKLKAMGVRAVVVRVGDGCPGLDSLIVHDDPGGPVQTTVRGHDGHIDSITVNASGIPADETMILAFQSDGGATFGSSGFVTGPVPACVSLPAPGALPAGSSTQGTLTGP